MKLRIHRGHARGLTLLELVVVVGILALFAGLVSYRLTPDQMLFAGAGGNKTAGRIATEATMARIKEAMFGSSGAPGYWADMNRDMWFWPRYLEWLSQPPTDATADAWALPYEEGVYYTSMMGYSASRKVGWRGPYVSFEGRTIPLDPARGYTARLGGGVHRAPIDAWGNAIVMQWPSVAPDNSPIIDYGTARGDVDLTTFITTNSRLVSPGPDGILQTEINLNSLQTYSDFLANPALAGDDVVYWLQR